MLLNQTCLLNLLEIKIIPEFGFYTEQLTKMRQNAMSKLFDTSEAHRAFCDRLRLESMRNEILNMWFVVPRDQLESLKKHIQEKLELPEYPTVNHLGRMQLTEDQFHLIKSAMVNLMDPPTFKASDQAIKDFSALHFTFKRMVFEAMGIQYDYSADSVLVDILKTRSFGSPADLEKLDECIKVAGFREIFYNTYMKFSVWERHTLFLKMKQIAPQLNVAEPCYTPGLSIEQFQQIFKLLENPSNALSRTDRVLQLTNSVMEKTKLIRLKIVSGMLIPNQLSPTILHVASKLNGLTDDELQRWEQVIAYQNLDGQMIQEMEIRDIIKDHLLLSGFVKSKIPLYEPGTAGFDFILFGRLWIGLTTEQQELVLAYLRTLPKI